RRPDPARGRRARVRGALRRRARRPAHGRPARLPAARDRPRRLRPLARRGAPGAPRRGRPGAPRARGAPHRRQGGARVNAAATPAPPAASAETRAALSGAAQRRVLVGMVALCSLGAFEALAVATAMPAIAVDLDGLRFYTFAF